MKRSLVSFFAIAAIVALYGVSASAQNQVVAARPGVISYKVLKLPRIRTVALSKHWRVFHVKTSPRKPYNYKMTRKEAAIRFGNVLRKVRIINLKLQASGVKK